LKPGGRQAFGGVSTAKGGTAGAAGALSSG